jgi:hypothetical protein
MEHNNSSLDIETENVFNYMFYKVKYKQANFSNFGLEYVRKARFFLKDKKCKLELSLNSSTLNIKDEEKKIYSVLNNTEVISKEGIKKTLNLIPGCLNQLNYLIIEPEEFYDSKEREELLQVCKKIEEGYLVRAS